MRADPPAPHESGAAPAPKPIPMGVRIRRSGGSWILETELAIARRAEDVFPFFADARNLGRITPDFMGFEVLTPGPIEMEAGRLIDYRIRLHGIPLPWRTRIVAWEPPVRFVDEQIRGPYRRWVHEHRFEPRGSWTICRDRVEYAFLGGPLAHRWLVGPRLREIFEHRRRRIRELMEDGPARVNRSSSQECGSLWPRSKGD